MLERQGEHADEPGEKAGCPRHKVTTKPRPLVRLALLTAGLAPVVALVLIGFSWFQSATPEWVYWKAKLIFLIVLEIAYGVTAFLSLLGTFVLGFLLSSTSGQGRRASRFWPAGSCCASPFCAAWPLCELVCAGWISWSHRFTAVPVGGLGIDDRTEPSLRFAKPLTQVDLRTRFPRPAR